MAMTIPVVLRVLESNPEVEIDFLTRPFMAKLLPEHPRLRAIGADVDGRFSGFNGLRKLTRELKSRAEYDAVADLHFVLRSRVIAFFMKSRKTKVAAMDKGRDEKKALTRKNNKVRKALRPMTERYADVFRALGLPVELSHQLTSAAGRKGIGFAPFAQHRGKSWPLDYARELLERFNAENTSVLLFGGPDELGELKELSEGLEHVSIHRGKGLATDVLAMKSLNLVISMDSANMHLASLAGVPVVSIWGATHPDAGFLGYGQSTDHAVQISVEELECRPCSVFGNVPCHRGDYACMNRISPERVHTAVEKLRIEQSGSSRS